MNKQVVTTATISALAGAAIGAAITHVVTKKRVAAEYEAWANDVIQTAAAAYDASDRNSTLKGDSPSEYKSQTEDVEEASTLIKNSGYSSEEVAEESTDGQLDADVFNVLEQDYESELEEESGSYIPNSYEIQEGAPYLITPEAFFENDDYEKDTLTYYEDDYTLTDNQDKQIDRVDQIIGERHLGMFHATDGDKTIYVRNERLQSDYEVVIVNGAYSTVVLGMTPEDVGIKPPKPRVQRMRDGDDQ